MSDFHHLIGDFSMTSISVAMATYNGAGFIREQLDSIASQILLPSELVVTDDGSTDETIAVIEAFASKAPFPIRVHRNAERLGYKANFMRCAGLCSGDLIAFSDQDDIWLPQKLEVQCGHFDDPRVLLSSHNVKLMDTDGTVSDETWDMFPRTGLLHIDHMLPFAYNFGFTEMMRRELLNLSGYWNNPSIDPSRRMAHDEYYFFLASLASVCP
jgi:glycosyltransferase involved in cell wall biosynthesis